MLSHLTPIPSTIELGRRLPDTPYEPLERLGEGSSGEVLRARHVELSFDVVVKLLHFTVEAAPDLAERLRLEAQALARLRHPNIVRVIDYGVSGGRPFLVMEYAGSRTLADVLADARPGLEDSLSIARQLLGALAHVHDAGMVHRDVKPSNVIFGADGKVRLIDFGVVKLLGAARGDLTPLAVPTETGMSLGTPRYLSPEQARGAAVDGRADVYAMGLVLYELLAGRAAFAHHDEVGALLLAQVREVPPPPSRHAQISPALDAVVMKAIAKRPEDRHESAAAFAAALDAAAGETRRDTAQPTEVMGPESSPPTTRFDTPLPPPPAPLPTPLPEPAPPGSVGAAPRALAFAVSSSLFMLLTLLALIALRKTGVLP